MMMKCRARALKLMLQVFGIIFFAIAVYAFYYGYRDGFNHLWLALLISGLCLGVSSFIVARFVNRAVKEIKSLQEQVAI